MPHLRALVAAPLALAMVALSAGATGWPLPPIPGELSGDFTPLKFPLVPTLHWKLTLQSADPASRAADLSIDGRATHLRAELHVDPAGDGTWRLVEANLDVSQWFEFLAPLAGDALQGTRAEGAMSVTGDGTIRDAALDGHLQVDLRDAAVRNAAEDRKSVV